jgi:hypothetical protein
LIIIFTYKFPFSGMNYSAQTELMTKPCQAKNKGHLRNAVTRLSQYLNH